MTFLLYLIVMAAVILGLARVLPGLRVEGWLPAIVAALVLTVVHWIVKPILVLITLPLTILTFGLFLFVINALMLWLTGLLVPGFQVRGLFTALLASLVLSLVGTLWKAATK